MNFICFDLEGPLSPHDNAYELMKLFPNGDKIFEVISRYDDLLTLEEREDYEPGDIVALRLWNKRLHIGIVTNIQRHFDGRWMVVHNIGRGPKLEDVLFDWPIVGHYRYR